MTEKARSKCRWFHRWKTVGLVGGFANLSNLDRCIECGAERTVQVTP